MAIAGLVRTSVVGVHSSLALSLGRHAAASALLALAVDWFAPKVPAGTVMIRVLYP